MVRNTTLAALLALSPFLMAAKTQGCVVADGAPGGDGLVAPHRTGAPDVRGDWSLTWQDDLEVEITIGGTSHSETLGPQGGLVTIDHQGEPFTFDLDCSRDVVVCPSEVWPDRVTFDQDLSWFPRNVYVTIPSHECDGEIVDVEPAACGPEAETCQQCDGTTTLSQTETIGRISFDDERLVVFLNAGMVTNGVNCALLGLSVAKADLETTAPDSDDYRAVALTNGRVITGVAGGCLWVADPDADGQTEAVALGASIRLGTRFTAHFMGEVQ